MTKPLFTIIAAALLLTACSKSTSDEEPSAIARRTVVVYMSAENNLGGLSFDRNDISEMAKGMASVGDDCRLLVCVDPVNAYVPPFIAQVTKDSQHPLDTLYHYEQDFYASDGEMFREVLSRAIALRPAQDYGLVLWGHASGWVVEKDTVANALAGRRAYGVDTGDNTSGTRGKWMNIPTMARALEGLGVKFRFIFSDCCNMQNVETAYELRHAADYLIGSPAEIDGKGAPYDVVVKDFFLADDEQMYRAICDDYHAQVDYVGGHLPISVVRTDRLDSLAEATRQVLPTVAAQLPKDDFGRGHIYYFGLCDSWGTFLQDEKTLYDMNDIIRWGLADDEASYKAWRRSFDAAVVYSLMSTYWHANTIKRIDSRKTFADFDVTADAYGGLSMFFPQTKHDRSPYYRHNELIKQMQWYYAVGWSAVGW